MGTIGSIIAGVVIAILILAMINQSIKNNLLHAELDDARADAKKMLRDMWAERAKHKAMDIEMRHLLVENTRHKGSFIRITTSPISTSFTVDERCLAISDSVLESMRAARMHLRNFAEEKGVYIVTDFNVERTDFNFGAEYTVSAGTFPWFSVPPSGAIEINGQRVLAELDETDITEIEKTMTRWSRRPVYNTPLDPPASNKYRSWS